MADQPKPRISNVTKFFVPGLVIGLAVGGLGGAYYSSRFEGPAMQEIKPKGPVHPAPKQQSGRPEDATEPAATGATAATGQTGSTGSTPAPK